MLQDFNFKILHRLGLKHTNVEALRRNLVGQAMDDVNFSEEIQDIIVIQVDTPKTKEKIFSIQIGEDLDWFGFRKQTKKLTQHHRCYFGINHQHCSKDHQLHMLDVVMEVNHDEETDSLMEDVGITSNEENEIMRTTDGERALKRKISKYYDRQQQLELVFTAQELSKFGDHELGHIDSDEKEKCGMDIKKH